MRRTAVTLLALLPFAAPARSQTPVAGDVRLPPEMESEFRAADTDRSGSLSKEEARGGQVFFAERFASIDADQNGIVTLFELVSALTTSTRRWMADFDAADTDRDGVLSEEELAAAPASVQRLVRGLDTSAQAQLTRERYESTAQRQLYDSVELPAVAPNIFEKKF
jgi:Ca2+-binding EF-hand superfamily protein